MRWTCRRPCDGFWSAISHWTSLDWVRSVAASASLSWPSWPKWRTWSGTGSKIGATPGGRLRVPRYRSRVSRIGASMVWDGRWLPMRRKLSLGEAQTRRASVRRWRISGSAKQLFRDTAPRDGGNAGRASPIFWARWKGTHGVYPFHCERSHQVPPRTFTGRLGVIKSGFANCGAILVARITRQIGQAILQVYSATAGRAAI